MTPLQYVRAVLRFWWLVLPCVAIGIPVASTFVATTPSTYTSSSSILVAPTPLGGSTSSEKYATNQLAQQRMFTYEGLAAGAELVDAVRQGLGTDTTPAEVRRDIVITVPDNSTVLNIVARAGSQSTAEKIASLTAASLTKIINRLENASGPQNALLRARVTTLAGSTTTVTPPPEWRNAALGGVGGLIVGLALAVIASRLDPRLREDETVAEVVAAPVLGVLPMRTRSAAQFADRSQGRFHDSVRELRTSLFFRNPRGDACFTVALTSPRQVEGASVVAGDLAAALVETGARVLLVVADLHGQGQAPLMEELAHEPTGLATYLTGASTADEVIWRDELSGVDVLPAGQDTEGAGDLLHSKAFAALLHDVAQSYDFVLVTTPPTSPGTDALAVAARCDGTVLMVPARTRKKQLRTARVMLDRVDARILGSVRLT